MHLDQEAVRALMLYLEDHLEIDERGRGTYIRIKDIANEELLPFPQKDIFLAAFYLKEKRLIHVRQEKSVPGAPKINLTPHAYKVDGISAAGYDYLSSIRDETIWKKLKEKFSDITSASIPQIIAVAAELTAKSLL